MHYLVVPRFLACVLLIPLLTVLADVMGMFGGGLICLSVYGIEPHHYWEHGKAYLRLWDIFTSLAKATVFGAFIALSVAIADSTAGPAAKAWAARRPKRSSCRLLRSW